ncbi:MAG: SLBB domain-containing protein [Fimbriimonadaceae bacterium]|nr:SLBB domain-containing protein [Fimbriimonadaceae bacterium]
MTISLRIFSFLVLLCGLVGFAMAQDKVIKPGDKVKMTCEEEPSLNREYTITKDGFILLSFVGAVQVGGSTEQSASDKVAAELVKQKILSKATVTIRLVLPDAPVKFTGAVKTASELPFRKGLKLVEVIKIAEPTESADMERIEITSATGEKIIVNFTLYQGLNEQHNPELRPGDMVFFVLKEKPKEVFVLGAITNPGAQPWSAGLTLRQALQLAGGFTNMSDKAKVSLERAGDVIVYDLNIASADATLQDQDRITVDVLKERRFVFVDGQVKRPGSVEYREGKTISQAINEAGGPQGNANLSRVKLVRKGTVQEEFVNVDRIMKGFAPDMPLTAGDNIIVPKAGRKLNTLTIIGAAAALFFLIGR